MIGQVNEGWDGDAWSYSWSGSLTTKEGQAECQRRDFWHPSLVLDAVQQLNALFHQKQAAGWDYYNVNAQYVKDPVQIRLIVSADRTEKGEVVDSVSDFYVLNVLEADSALNMEESNINILPRSCRAEPCSQFLLAHLTECTASHKSCATAEPFRLPTRLISVGSRDDEVQLVETSDFDQDTSADYAILSYCWGKGRVVKTTSGYIAAHKARLPFGDLPRTIRDAVELTRRLHLRYLWVDSLCIIQDSQTDWEQEAAMMSDYYKNAHLTIAATASPSADTGFLIERQQLSEPIDLTLTSASGLACRVRAQHRNDDACLKYTDTALASFGPWSDRGWTFQEHLLARRVVLFTDVGMIWQCSGRNVREDGSTRMLRKPQRLANFLRTPRTAGDLFQRWDNLVEAYSQRSLSYWSDRLPALSGIAKEFGHVIGGRYLAGHWEKHLVESLAWKTNWNPIDSDVRGQNTRSQCESPDKLAAPSWSWASTSGPVEFQWYSTRVGPSPVLARLDEVSCQAKGANPYGITTEGSLTVTGPFLALEGFLSVAEGAPASEHYISRGVDGNGATLTVSPDVFRQSDYEYSPEPGPHPILELRQPVFCLQIFRDFGLILKRARTASTPETFVRVGLVTDIGSAMNDASTRTIVLV